LFYVSGERSAKVGELGSDRFCCCRSVCFHHAKLSARRTFRNRAKGGGLLYACWRTEGASLRIQRPRINLASIEELHKTLLQEKKATIANAVDEDRRVALAWIDHAEGKNEDAIRLLQDVAAKEEGIFAPDGGIPAHEMLGDMLLDMNSPQRALKEYESEPRLNPNRFDSLSGAALAAEAAGQPKTAERYSAQLVKVCEGGNSQRPELLRARSVLAASGQMGRQPSEF
jgi:hypothetical protein